MPDTRSSQGLALWSVPVALLVLALKLLAWRLTGSVALLSDALESVVNVVAALLAWYALRVAVQPSDSKHPFGHHKAEYLSAVTEGTLIVLAALLIFREAAQGIFAPALNDTPTVGLLVNALAALANGLWASVLVRQGRRRRSPALIASGRHLYADVWTSAGVLLGVTLAVLTGWHILDPLLAILVGLHILYEGVRVVLSSIDGLMDSAAAPKDRAEIERVVAESASGALQIHDVRTRQAGPRLFIEFHLVVPGQMTVTESHAICDRIETGLCRVFPASVTTIHVEPEHKTEDNGFAPRQPV